MRERIIRTAISLPPEGQRIDFGPMCLVTVRRVEDYLARTKPGLRGRRDLKAEFRERYGRAAR